MRNHKTAEKVPKHIKRSGNDGSDVVIWRESCGHHSVEGEVEHGEIHEEQVPNELQNCPLKRSHGVENGAVNY